MATGTQLPPSNVQAQKTGPQVKASSWQKAGYCAPFLPYWRFLQADRQLNVPQRPHPALRPRQIHQSDRFHLHVFWGVRPYLRPVSKIFRLSCALNTPVSQNTSQNLAIFCSATAGIISSHKRRIYASRFPLYSEGSAWAPIKVATTSTACLSCNFWIARSCFSSSSVVRPYPLLASQVVVPKDSISLNARDAFSVSSSSLADRVLLTVERIPPPWARISR